MDSSWAVLVLPMNFITPGKRPFVNTILRIHCQNIIVISRTIYM